MTESAGSIVLGVERGNRGGCVTHNMAADYCGHWRTMKEEERSDSRTLVNSRREVLNL